MHLGLDGVPEGVNARAVQAWLAKLPGVASVHDLHIWALSTTTTALTAHLVMPDGSPGDTLLAKIAHDLEHEFGIGHVTIQVERGQGAAGGGGVCRQAPEDVI